MLKKLELIKRDKIFVEDNAYCEMDWWEIKCMEFETTRDCSKDARKVFKLGEQIGNMLNLVIKVK